MLVGDQRLDTILWKAHSVNTFRDLEGLVDPDQPHIKVYKSSPVLEIGMGDHLGGSSDLSVRAVSI